MKLFTTYWNFIKSKRATDIIVFLALSVLISINIITNVCSIFTAPIKGDEYFYVSELERFYNSGLESLYEGISIFFIILSWVLNQLFHDYLISLRMVSLISIVILSVVFYQMIIKLKFSGKYIFFALCTFIVLLITQKSLFYGINDSLMLMLSILSCYYLIRYFYSDSIGHLIISALCLGLSFWVRSFSAFYLLGILTGFLGIIFYNYRNKILVLRYIKVSGIFVLFVVFFGIIPHIPSLIKSGTFAFENKNSSELNWNHRNWLDHIYRKPAGSVFAYNRTSWDEVKEYVEEKGKDSIPISIMDRLKKDPKFFFDNIITNLFFRLPFLLVFYTGVIGLIFLNIIRKIKFKVKHINNLYAVFAGIILILSSGLSLYIITYIESRWFLMAMLLVVLIVSKELSENKIKNERLIIYSQYVFLIMQSVFVLF